MEQSSVGILIFENVEVLDFAGPFEVFSRTRTLPGPESRRSQEFTVAKTNAPVLATGGLTVVPDYSFEDAPNIDLLVVPGGFGTRALLEDEKTLTWIRSVAAKARQTTSVCTGSLLLAKAAGPLRIGGHWISWIRLMPVSQSIERAGG